MYDKTLLVAEIIKTCDPSIVETISELEPLFPVKIQDDKDHIVNNLMEPDNINIFLKNGQQIIGYLLATPQNSAVRDLKSEDTKMNEDDERYYIDKIVVQPEYRAGQAFLVMIDKLLREVGLKGMHKVSSHVLADNGLNKSIKAIYRKYITKTRIVKLEAYDNAFFEYIEFTYSDKYVARNV